MLIWPLVARAQQAGKIPRVGFMGNSTVALEANLVSPFREGLHELGYQEGRNIVIEYRWAEGKYERFPALVVELLAVPVDLIVTAGTPATLAVKKATSTVPLVNRSRRPGRHRHCAEPGAPGELIALLAGAATTPTRKHHGTELDRAGP
jgi:putative ABC transport system substrate-binding protein